MGTKLKISIYYVTKSMLQCPGIYLVKALPHNNLSHSIYCKTGNFDGKLMLINQNIDKNVLMN